MWVFVVAGTAIGLWIIGFDWLVVYGGLALWALAVVANLVNERREGRECRREEPSTK